MFLPPFPGFAWREAGPILGTYSGIYPGTYSDRGKPIFHLRDQQAASGRPG